MEIHFFKEIVKKYTLNHISVTIIFRIYYSIIWNHTPSYLKKYLRLFSTWIFNTLEYFREETTYILLFTHCYFIYVKKKKLWTSLNVFVDIQHNLHNFKYRSGKTLFNLMRKSFSSCAYFLIKKLLYLATLFTKFSSGIIIILKSILNSWIMNTKWSIFWNVLSICWIESAYLKS